MEGWLVLSEVWGFRGYFVGRWFLGGLGALWKVEGGYRLLLEVGGGHYWRLVGTMVAGGAYGRCSVFLSPNYFRPAISMDTNRK